MKVIDYIDMIIFVMNNNLLGENLMYTKSIQERQPSYWGRKSKNLTRSTRLDEEKLGTEVTTQSKRAIKKVNFS
jgi:hypothetical protein